MSDWRIIEADCVEAMAAMPEASIDAVVCDPPYGIGFMGKTWDGPAIAAAAARDRERRANLGPESASRPGRTQPRSSSAFGNEAIIAGPVRGGRDFQAWCEAWAAEALRVLKPGGHLLAFGGTRTSHRLACAIEDAGFEIRDTICWLYGSGFPKSLDVSKAIDKTNGSIPWLEFAPAFAGAVEAKGMTYTDVDRALGVEAAGSSSCYWARTDHRGGLPARHHWDALRDLLDLPAEMSALYDEAEREVVAHRERRGMPPQPMWSESDGQSWDETAPSTPEAQQWEGWGTALKPAFEPVVVARKPLAGTVSANVLAHGTGALNIDGCRIDFQGDADEQESKDKNRHGDFGTEHGGNTVYGDYTRDEGRDNYDPPGRWPANVVLDPEAGEMLDEQTGEMHSHGGGVVSGSRNLYGAPGSEVGRPIPLGDSGGASRFMTTVGADRFRYVAKASSAERGAGLNHAQDGKICACPEPKASVASPPKATSEHGFSTDGADRATSHESSPTSSSAVCADCGGVIAGAWKNTHPLADGQADRADALARPPRHPPRRHGSGSVRWFGYDGSRGAA